ncbi:MAG: DUF5654 family protein [Candidatus Aenigmatarchaeota archaeon]
MAKKNYITLKQQILWLISTAFGIAAALFWKDTISLFITQYVPAKESLLYSFYASIITSILAILAVWLAHLLLKK